MTVSSPNHIFSWASLNKLLTSTSCTYYACNWQQSFLNDSAEERRMTVEIISQSISTKVWKRAVIELPTPGSAVRDSHLRGPFNKLQFWTSIKGHNASVTFAFRWVYIAHMMSKSPFPCGLRRETLRSNGFTGILASTILFNSAQWQIWKNCKPVAHRHIAVTSYYTRTGTSRWSWGQRTISDWHFWLVPTQYGPRSVCWWAQSNQGP